VVGVALICGNTQFDGAEQVAGDGDERQQQAGAQGQRNVLK
jgi:hypothetical protein